MKKIIALLLLMTATVYVSGQVTTVKLKLPDPCSNTSNIKNKNTGKDFVFTVSPNPSKGEFSLNISYSKIIGKTSIEVYSLQGKLLYSESIYCSSTKCIKSLDLKHLAKGVYTLSLRSNGLVKTEKIIIQ